MYSITCHIFSYAKPQMSFMQNNINASKILFNLNNDIYEKMSPLFSTIQTSPILHPKPSNFRSIKYSHDNLNHTSTTNCILPPRPRRIILVRHGQSQGNVDECIYTRVADPKVGLTEKGISEAEKCGIEIKKMIEKDDDWKVYFYVSPYLRTLQTLRNLAKAFGRSRIVGVREEPRLREQDFGNFQEEEEMKTQKAVRNLYGRFFYRFPNGESAADVYDRITGFKDTLRSDMEIGRFQPPGEQSPNMNLIIVSHGLTLRVFLMRWYKWTVEQFEGLYNIPSDKILVMERGHGGRYSLLMQHTKEELKEFGLTDAMLIDQEWQMLAKPGDINYDCLITGPSFFTHFDEDGDKPDDIMARKSSE